MEDSRFQEVRSLKKKDVPHQLHWFLKEDYFSEELFGFQNSEVQNLKFVTQEAFLLFERATDQIIRNRELGYLNIPSFFHGIIEKTWRERQSNPLLCGRFDVSGGLDGKQSKVIEFNADTLSTLPETLLWQNLQVQQLQQPKEQFNNLATDIGNILMNLKMKINFPDPVLLASSFGYQEDVLNCNEILNIGSAKGYKSFYTDLPNVTFSDEGIFYEIGGEFQPVDVWFKMIPWDWMYNEEPELAKTLINIIEKKLCIVLNPPYTTIWQNKKFLAYITKYFPNNYIAETHLESFSLSQYVEKPIFGRLGENIQIKADQSVQTNGDFGMQEKIFQKYYPLPFDKENYFYQIGMFYTNKVSALNLRTQDSKIITDDCEFMSHFII